ncbi:hypothetical protein V1511DRAFT_494630 [Dipodascopsis uninucleata]
MADTDNYEGYEDIHSSQDGEGFRRSASPAHVGGARDSYDNNGEQSYRHEQDDQEVRDNRDFERPEESNRDDQEDATGVSLFVSGLHPRVTEDQVREMFSSFGVIDSCSIMRDPHSNEPRGFGFVSYTEHEHAVAAKESLEGETVESRVLQ